MHHGPCAALCRRAFSLLELSVVLMILGVLVAGGLTVGGIVVEQQANTATNEKLDILEQALVDFVKDQNRLPCVAPLDVLPASGTFGTELAAGGCLAATPTGTGTTRAVSGANIVRIGAVPTRTLGLKDNAASDEFGNRFLYAVTEAHTTSNAMTGFPAPGVNGQITVLDGAGNNITNVASFILLSHGPDGKGGLRHLNPGTLTSPPVACGTSTNLDVQNCDVTTTGTTPANLVTFRDARFNNGSVANQFFDDFTRFMPKFRLVAAASSTPSLWGNTGDNIYSVGNDSNTATGNVGIGTTSPGQLLHVTNGSAGGADQTIVQIGDGNRPLFLTHNAPNISGNIRYDDGQWRLHAAGEGSRISLTGAIEFITASTGAASAVIENAGFGTSRMLITSAGNVGIGTTAPPNRLTVLGEGTGIAQLGAGGCGGNYSGLTLGQTTAPACGNYNILSSPTDQTLYINRPTGAGLRFRENNADQMFIIGGGNVHIGPIDATFTANPTDRLEVNGTIFANNFTIPSDARLKHDITPIFAGEGLKILAGLSPVSFKWNEGNRADIGLIAQEVEKVLPAAVSKTNHGFLRVTYDKLILPVIAAVKELQAELEKLAADLAGLADRQSALEKRLAALEDENAALKEEVKTLKAAKAEN
ncbi:MAG: tail fiber domain-containing protein [Alphaproteobacteria bacterium]